MEHASDYNYEIDSKFNKAYLAEVLIGVQGTIGNSPISKGERVIVSICTTPGGYHCAVGCVCTSKGIGLGRRDCSFDMNTIKDSLRMIGAVNGITADECILDAIQIHNNRVW
jgi:hypothetical protein